MRRVFKFLPIFLLFFVLLPAIPVFAIDDPDSISVESVRVFEGLWEEGDMLFIVEHKVMDDPEPTEDPQDTYLSGIWDGEVKGPDRPLDYYQHNFTSVYLTEAEVTNFGYEFEDALSIKVAGNPSYFPSLTEGVNMATFSLSSGHWVNEGSLVSTRLALADWCVTLAETFEASWPGEVVLLTSTDKLNTIGRDKFLEAIPGLDGVCTDLFQVSTSYPEYEEPTYDPAFETTLLGNAGVRLTAVLEGLGKWTTGKEGMGGLVGGVGLAILFFVLAGRIFIATGSVPIAIVVSIPFLFAGNIIGILPLTITFIAAFLVVVMFSVTFILGRLG